MEGAAALFKLDNPSSIISLAAIAALLVLLNVVLHAFKEWFSDRHKRMAEDKAVIEREIRPLLTATSDLAARLVELLVQSGSRLQNAKWNPLPIPTGQQEDIADLHVVHLDRFHSTVVRLISVLALRERFRARTARISNNKRLDHIRYFLARKIPPALKGNIFGAEILSTEYADIVGAYFLPSEDSEVTTLSTLEKLHDPRGRRLFNLVGSQIAVNPVAIDNCVKSDRIPDDPEAMRVLAMAHFTIMAIDFYQNIDCTAHLEEERMVLCKFLAKYNKTREKACFLYERGDLSFDDDYLTTYGGFSLLGTTWPDRGRIRTCMVTKQLKKRAAKSELSHHNRKFSKDGLTLRLANSITTLKWNDTLATLMQNTNTFNLQTRRRVSVTPNITSIIAEKKGTSSSDDTQNHQ